MSASFDFRPVPNPHDNTSLATLHGQTHDVIARMIGLTSGIENRRYIDVVGKHGTLSGYVDADMFDAICLALGVQS